MSTRTMLQAMSQQTNKHRVRVQWRLCVCAEGTIHVMLYGSHNAQQTNDCANGAGRSNAVVLRTVLTHVCAERTDHLMLYSSCNASNMRLPMRPVL